jgi:cellobiose phosphorylase
MVVIFVVILVYKIWNRAEEGKNLMEDVPTININTEDLEKHAAQISSYYSEVKKSNCKRKIMISLDKSYNEIIKVYEHLDNEKHNKREVVPAAEWLLDNLYLIEKEYKDIRHNMPKSYYDNLPVINKGLMQGYPRVYHIALEIVSHTDGRVQDKVIESFIRSYEKTTILTMGELWALPIMIRIALIQNIGKITDKILFAQEEKNRGEALAERIIKAVHDKNVDLELKKLKKTKSIFTSHFTERFLKVLRDNGIVQNEVYKVIDDRLEARETSREKIINIEHAVQANFQISMGNCVTSIREVAVLNWRESFEKLSYVEAILRKDPLGVYENMDFESRDNYRHRIERLSKGTKQAESFVAKKALECAEEASLREGEVYLNHVGYYLIDDGIKILNGKININNNSKYNGLSKGLRANLYIGGTALLVVTLMAVMLYTTFINDNNPLLYKYIITALAIVIPISEIVISILNWSINHLITPCFIPKLELKEGIPEESSTVVVIPTLISSEKKVCDLVNDMEVYYLSNQEDNIYFALLADFKDSNSETEEEDELINACALREIKDLNSKYCSGGEEKFFFFNRYRQYNKVEDKWIGWERKRGKLMEFNGLLRGNNNNSYNVISGDIKNLLKVKYVITLDADTQLPRDTAKKLIGAMSHVLNYPLVDYKNKKVKRGYGIMQPRVSVGSLSANKTMFSKIFSGETGIDMYTSAISDVYQDVFSEGIFTGKGIYDVDVFSFMLAKEVPENSVLSHDLLEGCLARTALVTDIELIDGYPAYYNSSSMRLHRWVRGDWQLLPWIIKGSNLNIISRWKMFDNLRRSLLAPSLIILVILSLSILPSGELWLILAFLALLSPMIFDVTEVVVSPIRGISLSGRIENYKNVSEQVFLVFCFLPYNAYLMVDAIARTLYRLVISKKNLLEWKTAADLEQKLGKDIGNFISDMWVGSVLAAIIALLAFLQSFRSGVVMLFSSLLWFISPLIAYYISKERKVKKIELEEDKLEVLRKLGRKTWAYFEDFVNDENNWLAPDNYQEDPPKGLAKRTSPTNMAMGLTSNMVALDFGYIDKSELTDRIENIVTSMERLEKYKGHFYNWYNTETASPLFPRYISTVDSGNLVGYVWTVSQALIEYLKTPVMNPNMGRGFCDTLELANYEILGCLDIKNYYLGIIDEIKENELKNCETDILWWKKILLNIWDKATEAEGVKKHKELYWNSKAKNTAKKHLHEIEKLFPWLDMIIETPVRILELSEKLKKMPSTIAIEDINVKMFEYLNEINLLKDLNKEEAEFLRDISPLIKNGRCECEKLRLKIVDLRSRLDDISEATDFKILYSKKRQLFSIGYDREKDIIGNCFYDLLASEARAASFVAIAKGDVEQNHWFKLGRAITLMGKSKGLVSWSGTMFEYFMPILIMKNYPNTLLDGTYRAVIAYQKSYCKERKVPWGISESAYYGFDLNSNYQYKAFGAPGAGLKRGLSSELVISPYSTIMAMQFDVQGAYSNLQRLSQEGLEGIYGFYEAVDYTRERLPKGKKKVIIKCFMVHHQGMSLMALDNIINNNILQVRFHSMPKVKATELLLQERVTKRVIYDREKKNVVRELQTEKPNNIVRIYKTARTEVPETELLSNGNFSLMISNSGSGYSKEKDMTIYRWREDFTLDNSGMFFYIKNVNSQEYWSAAYEPCRDEGESYEVIFSLDRAEFKRRDGNISTHMEIAVSNEEDAEVRRITITNHSDHSRVVEVTSYCEITLSPYNADIVHPTFSNLFISTEYHDNPNCVIGTRRPRTKDEKKPYIVQVISTDGESVGTLQYETSRGNFIGRGRDLENPYVMENDTPLKNTVGAVLDPIISMRRRVKIKAGKSCVIAFTTAVANSRDEAIELAAKYKEMVNVKRVFELAWIQSAVEMKYLGIKEDQANIYQVMASKILFTNPSFREREEYIKNIKGNQSNLWSYGISGDSPIVLLLVRKENDIDLVGQLLHAHEYWSLKRLTVDLLIINLQESNYFEPLNETIRDLISSSHLREGQNKPGGVFIQSGDSVNSEDMNLLMAISAIVIDSEKGTLIGQVIEEKEEKLEKTIKIEDLKVATQEYSSEKCEEDLPKLEYFNELGGFDLDKNEYVIRLMEGKNTPSPWINVVSNKDFGFHVSESGSAYTWYKNSRENKVTSWSNDPVIDAPGEAMYLRDEITGELWSITPRPIRDQGEYTLSHGFGYSSFKHEAKGICGEVTMFAPINKNVKLCLVKLKNNSGIKRRLSLTYYAQIVLGVYPEQTSKHVSSYLNLEKKYIYAKNSYNQFFGKSIAYLKIIGGGEETFTGDRTEFIGRGGSLNNPSVLKKKKLSNTVGAGLDPCIASQARIDIEENNEVTLLVIFGVEEDIQIVEKTIQQYKDINLAKESLEKVKEYWKEMLGRIQVKTPDLSMDIMLNGWLMYQTIVCRYRARTAFYQSGGAYGFRDQLQDVMAIGYLDSNITKTQILYSASRQFLEGDVQHWWHPVVDSGIRTRFSDDLLWLPYVTIDYIKNTGDYSILDEEIAYLEEEPLAEGEDERYSTSRRSEVKDTLYKHCIKAIERSLKFGAHNIPLMGSGDWNDGMSTVGNGGKGESVWLGWFLYSILDNFIEICDHRSDSDKSRKYLEDKEFIKENLEKNAWDGGWYRRAYFDDGTPLGSAQNEECQIDSIAQSWSVISGAAKESRSKEAMEALEKHLIREDLGMVLLLNPPFNKSTLEPGYIKGYVPGVRENGAQYTHAAVWVILALTKLGYGNKANKIFHMINPINHAASYLECERYKVEPYVMSADVYIKEPHAGRGGWSWYTGASGWDYRTGIEGILGLKFKGEKGFTIEPCIPDNWPGYEMGYRKDRCQYNIKVRRGPIKSISLNGKLLENNIVPYLNSGIGNVEVII